MRDSTVPPGASSRRFPAMIDERGHRLRAAPGRRNFAPVGRYVSAWRYDGRSMLAISSRAWCPARRLARSRPLAVAEEFPRDMSVVGDALAWTDSRCVKGCGGFAFGSTELGQGSAQTATAALPASSRAHASQTSTGGSNSILEDIRFADLHPAISSCSWPARRTLPTSSATETRVLAGPWSRPRSNSCGARPTASPTPWTPTGSPMTTAPVRERRRRRVRWLRDGSEVSLPAEGRIGAGIALAERPPGRGPLRPVDGK